MLWLGFLASLMLFGSSSANSATDSALAHRLLGGYDKMVKAYDKTGGQLDLKLSLTPRRIIGLEDNTLDIDTWVQMTWKDQRLSWDPAYYDNQVKFHLPASEIWLPDLTIYNGLGPNGLTFNENNIIAVFSDGTVLFIPQSEIKSSCAVHCDEEDQVTCDIKMGSWTYSQTELDLIPDDVDMAEFMDINREWTLSNVTVTKEVKEYECCKDDPYVTLIYNFTLTKKH